MWIPTRLPVAGGLAFAGGLAAAGLGAGVLVRVASRHRASGRTRPTPGATGGGIRTLVIVFVPGAGIWTLSAAAAVGVLLAFALV